MKKWSNVELMEHWCINRLYFISNFSLNVTKLSAVCTASTSHAEKLLMPSMPSVTFIMESLHTGCQIYIKLTCVTQTIFDKCILAVWVTYI